MSSHTATMSVRKHPNIIITGTPGCGKTSHAESLVAQLGSPYVHYNVLEVAKVRKCFDSYDAVLDTHVVDEDKLLDSLEDDLRAGGAVIDWHCCDIFPERLIDLVVVLKCGTETLYDRLSKRGYKDNKIQENLDCEIMEVVWQDAASLYVPEIVIPLASDCVEDMELNVDRIAAWVLTWVENHPSGVTNELDPGLSDGSSGDEDEDGDEDGDEEEDEKEE